MRIKEVEDLTGLTRKAIRYYEENGLIQTVFWRLKNYVFWIFP